MHPHVPRFTVFTPSFRGEWAHKDPPVIQNKEYIDSIEEGGENELNYLLANDPFKL
jgi:hypothetical protein